MENYIEILQKTKLFSGVCREDVTSMLTCLNAKRRDYKKGEYVFMQGERVSAVTVLVKGNLHVQQDDYWGNRTIVNRIEVGDTFGESYITPDGTAMLNDVVAVKDSTVLFFDLTKMMTTCSVNCKFHSAVILNLFYSITEKNRKLIQKIEHISKRTTREKLTSYLSEQAKKHNSSKFFIPFNRQQLADFLSVDRSAMSNELCKMRDEGLLSFRKNEFILK